MSTFDQFDAQNCPSEEAMQSQPSAAERRISSGKKWLKWAMAGMFSVTGATGSGQEFSNPQDPRTRMLQSGTAANPVTRTTTPTSSPANPTTETPEQSPMERMRQSETFVSMDADILALEASVQAEGLMTIEHGYDESNFMEKTLHGRSTDQPIGFVDLPIVITAEAYGNPRNKLLLPCPRDFLDMKHVACKVTAFAGRRKVDVPATIVYSDPGEDGRGAVNPFILVDLTGSDTRGKVTVHAVHVLRFPEYDPVTRHDAIRRQPDGAAKQQALIEHRERALAYLGQQGPATRAAMEKALGIFWSEQTDCGYKAISARGMSPSVEVAEGFSWRDADVDDDFGGRHTINVAASNGGMTTFDAREFNPYIGPLNRFIPTAVGGPACRIPEFRDEVLTWTNYGHVLTGGGESTYKKATLSLQGFGPHANVLKGLRISPAVRAYADALWAENMKKYDPQSRVALGMDE